MGKKKDWYPSEEEQRNTRLKLWRKWMLHADPGAFNGWLILEQEESVASGW
jgi:hypothetical protein